MTFWSKLKVFLNTALILVLVLFIAINILQLVTGIVIIAVVRGTSMLPLLIEGDIVVITPSNNINLNDIVVYRTMYGKLIIHRVIAKIRCLDGEVLVVTKGDNNAVPDIVTYMTYGIRRSCVTTLDRIEVVDKRYLNYFVEIMNGEVIAYGIPTKIIVGKVLSLPIPMKISSIGVLSLR